MGKDHNRRARAAAGNILLEPLELLLAELAELTRLQIHHIDEPDEMHAVGIEAVPAGALGILAVALAIELYLLVDEIVLARHVVHGETSFGDGVIGIV